MSRFSSSFLIKMEMDTKRVRRMPQMTVNISRPPNSFGLNRSKKLYKTVLILSRLRYKNLIIIVIKCCKMILHS